MGGSCAPLGLLPVFRKLICAPFPQVWRSFRCSARVRTSGCATQVVTGRAAAVARVLGRVTSREPEIPGSPLPCERLTPAYPSCCLRHSQAAHPCHQKHRQDHQGHEDGGGVEDAQRAGGGGEEPRHRRALCAAVWRPSRCANSNAQAAVSAVCAATARRRAPACKRREQPPRSSVRLKCANQRGTR